jgi:hypothetical protein
VLDLRGELEVAYHLLNERRLDVAYEPYASAKRRGPDFAVTYRANLVFNIEVARIRAEEGSANSAGSAGLRRQEERILRPYWTSWGKAAVPNLLVIHIGGPARSIRAAPADAGSKPG